MNQVFQIHGAECECGVMFEHTHQDGTLKHPIPSSSENNWEKQFTDKFFVYKLGGKHPDHVGAHLEAVEFIRGVIKQAKEEERVLIIDAINNL